MDQQILIRQQSMSEAVNLYRYRITNLMTQTTLGRTFLGQFEVGRTGKSRQHSSQNYPQSMVTRCCPVSLSTRTQNSSVGAFTKLGRRHCLSQTNAFGRLWGPTGSVINRINYSVKTVEPNDYNTQKKTCGYDMLVGSGSIALDTTWYNYNQR